MLKFIKHYADTIIGIEIYPMISFFIFFLFFLVLLIYVYRSDTKTLDEISQLPLDLDDFNQTKSQKL